MINLINESTETLLKSWKNKVDAAGGVASINIDQHMRSFSGDVISRACFGSNFAKGEEIFHKLRALQEAMSKKVLSTGIPGMRCEVKYLFLPKNLQLSLPFHTAPLKRKETKKSTVA